jgi:NADH-quinone oxidoreductase subunit M
MTTTLLILFFVYAIGSKHTAKAAIGVSLIQFILTIGAYLNFNAELIWNDVFTIDWIKSLSIQFSVGYDGISLLFVLLTNILFPIIIASGANSKFAENKTFFALALIMQSALIGVFTSRDLFLFYIFWELALLPIYFIALQYGDEDRKAVTFKFFLYTLVGSLFMLAGILFVYLKTLDHSFSIESIHSLKLSIEDQSIAFVLFFAAFAIKMPIFPLHTWQPSTYTSAPNQGTMMLSGVMLKMGVYGIIRWILPIMPDAVLQYGDIVILLSVIGLLYASIIAIKQENYKTLIAYASIAHVGLIAAGLFTHQIEGIQGALIQAFSHGINIVGLFLVIDMIQQRTGTLSISALGGLRNQAPQLNVFFIIILFANVALPLTNGFVGEFMLFVSLFKYNPYIAGVAAISIILGAVYMLSSFQKIMLGEARVEYNSIQDLTIIEKIILLPIILMILYFGIFPNCLLEITKQSVELLFSAQ